VPERLTSFDASFLANEKANGHMAIGAIVVCEGTAPGQDDFLAHIRGRLHLLPRFRQRLAFPPLQLGRPFWVDHPEFDLAAHVRRVSLAAPGDDERFHELIGEILSPPLDRSRPLWELWLVDGFADDRFGIVYKTHHALADGISAVDIGTLLFDVEPNSEPARDEGAWDPQRPPSRLGLLARAFTGFGRSLARMARYLGDAIRQPGVVGRRAADGLAGLWEVTWALTKPAPKVPLNVDIGPNRRFGWTRCNLEEFKQVKNALGGTVNDISLAVCAGALRRWLQDRDLPVDGLELKALVAVSIRAEDQRGELGNKLTAMRAPLPVGVADPVERLHTISTAMDALKSSKQPLGAEAIWGINDWLRDFAPPVLLAPTAAINFSTRLFNLLVTNFPGPQIPFYVLGRELVGVYPVGFLAKRHALAIAIISYNGQVDFGFLADRDSFPDLDRLATYVSEEFERLRAAAAVGLAPTPKATQTL
jgi:diacylglycerol O-acyltransferase / wax synthase